MAATTPTVKTQEPLAGIVPPVRVTLDAPPPPAHCGAGVAVDVPVEAVPPAQVVLAPPDVTTPLGNVSVSGAFRVAAVALALFKVIVTVEAPPAAMVAGLKALPRVTEEGAGTVNVATAGAELVPLLVTKVPTASELM